MKRRALTITLALLTFAAPGFATEPDARPAPASAATPAADDDEDDEDAAPAAPAAASTDPEAQVEAFFIGLAKGEVDQAYDKLLKGTRIADVPADVLMLKKNTRDALKLVDGIHAAELLERKSRGTHLRRLTYLSLGAEYPLQWRFFFYKRSEGWKLIDIRISDRLPDIYGEATENSEKK